MAKILVIDDDLGVRQSLQRWLASNGFEVRTVSAVVEAVPGVIAWADVVVTDGSTTADQEHFPVHDGWRLAVLIQRDGGKVLVHSGVDLRFVYQGVPFVSKKAGPEALLTAVNRLLASTSS